jgi:exonuclease III
LGEEKMPFYQHIDASKVEGARIAQRLLTLRKQLSKEIPQRFLNENLLLATWNIREFDSKAYGDRISESFYYIAEIIDCFDLVAVQEIRKDLKGLKKLMRILGGYWKYIITDVTKGSKGNKERMAFLYDSRKVRFGGLAGELVLPPVKDEHGILQPVSQLARTPFMCGFTAGWTQFILTTVHILYGKSKAETPERIEEIRQLSQFLKERTEDKTAWSRNLILLGDFNIFKSGNKTMKAIEDADFFIPDKIKKLPSNAPKNKHYDQIAFRIRQGRLGTTGQAGVFDFYKTVFRDQDQELYIPDMGERYFKNSKNKLRNAKSQKSYYKTYWRTHQMSDHLPMWVELKIDYSDQYLERKLAPSG